MRIPLAVAVARLRDSDSDRVDRLGGNLLLSPSVASCVATAGASRMAALALADEGAQQPYPIGNG